MINFPLLITEFILLGSVAGFSAGLLGIGGGVIVVPGLVYIFQFIPVPPKFIMQIAAGTSLAVMVPTTFCALLTHSRRGTLIWPLFSQLVLGVVIGAMIGSLLAHIAPSKILRIIFGVFLLFMAFRLWFVLTPSPKRQLPGKLGLNLFGSVVGINSGLLGIGGGVLTIPFLSSWHVVMTQAVAVSNAVSFAAAVVGMVSFAIIGMNVDGLPAWSTGFIYWPAWAPIALASLLMAPFGVKLSYRLSPTVLKRIFAVFLLIVSFQMLKVID